MAKEKDNRKKPGCGCGALIGGVVAVMIIGWIADMAGCNKPEETPAEKIAKELAGPNNPTVQRINSLSAGNAYSAGYNDGMLEVAKMAQKFSTMRGDMIEQLRNFPEGRNILFDMIGTQTSDNHVNPSVLAEYRRGWNGGWNTMHEVR